MNLPKNPNWVQALEHLQFLGDQLVHEGKIEQAENADKVLADMYTVLSQAGWSDDAVQDTLAFVFNGVPAHMMDQARRKAVGRSQNIVWNRWEKDDDTCDTARELRAHLGTFKLTTSKLPEPGGSRFALGEKESRYDWIVPDFLLRRKVHMCSGGVHSFKSGLHQIMMLSSLTGRPFLGRQPDRLRWLVIDAENSQDDVANFWGAMGFNEKLHWPDVHFTGRKHAVQLGDPEWNDWIREEAAAFRPDVVLIDTIVRATNLDDTKSDTAVTRLYADVLVPLADENNAAVIFTAHMRKSGGRLSTDEAVNGSVQWGGQAEQTYNVANVGPLEKTVRDDGTFDTRRKFVIHWPKGRTLSKNVGGKEYFYVVGNVNADGSTNRLWVESPNDAPTLQEQIVATLSDQALGSGALAKALGMNRSSTKFRDALKEAEDAGIVRKTDDGLYATAA